MISISLCMIVKNEEEVLARCLESVKETVDEIIIVDTGSKDKTKEIAFKYTDKVFDFKWRDDFSKARNYSFSKAESDYILWLDADDVLMYKDKEKLKNLKETINKNLDVIMMKYNTSFDENGNVTFSYYRERLIKNIKKDLWKGFIHEAISPFGNVFYSDIAVTHMKIRESDKDRNIEIFEKHIKKGETLSKREQFYYSRELFYHERYNEAIDNFNKFLNMKDIFLENRIDAYRLLSYCHKKTGNPTKEIQILFESFIYDTPRAEVCCDIGNYFLTKNNIDIAVYWYKRALECERKDEKGGFISEDCYGYIPLIQLCVCYDKKGNIKKANEYNELAGVLKPASREYKLNKEYFNRILNE